MTFPIHTFLTCDHHCLVIVAALLSQGDDLLPDEEDEEDYEVCVCLCLDRFFKRLPLDPYCSCVIKLAIASLTSGFAHDLKSFCSIFTHMCTHIHTQMRAIQLSARIQLLT